MTQQRSEDTRKLIMAAAVEVFCRSGYDAAGVAEICSLAGVSKGAFYHHFPSKKALFLAIMQAWLSGLDDRLNALRQPNVPVSEALLQMSRTIGSVFSDASGQLPMFLEFMVQASRDKTVWEATIAPYQAYQTRFAQMLEEGKNEGSIRGGEDAQAASWVLIAFAVGVLLQGVVLPETADWETIAGRGMAMLVDSMQRSKE
jgi:AcrR family transcriptional regulator